MSSDINSLPSYTPTLKEWAIPLVLVLLGGACFVNLSSLLHSKELALWPAWALPGCAAVGWAVAWLQQVRRPWLRELAGLAAAGCWCLSVIWTNIAFRLGSSYAVLLTIFLGLAWVPWVLRQRVVLGAVMMLSIFLTLFLTHTHYGILSRHDFQDLPTIENPATWFSLLPLVVIYGWWMLAERLRERGGRYACYAWVGMPACALCQITVVCTLAAKPQEPALLQACVMAALALLLRPRVAWQAWLAAVATAVIPLAVCVPAAPRQLVLWGASLLLPAAMLWLAVAQRRREWVISSAIALFVAFFTFPEWNYSAEHVFYKAAGSAFLLTLTIYLYRKTCRAGSEAPGSPGCASAPPYPPAFIILPAAVTLGAQLLYCALLQYELCSTPPLFVQAKECEKCGDHISGSTPEGLYVNYTLPPDFHSACFNLRRRSAQPLPEFHYSISFIPRPGKPSFITGVWVNGIPLAELTRRMQEDSMK